MPIKPFEQKEELRDACEVNDKPIGVVIACTEKANKKSTRYTIQGAFYEEIRSDDYIKPWLTWADVRLTEEFKDEDKTVYSYFFFVAKKINGEVEIFNPRYVGDSDVDLKVKSPFDRIWNFAIGNSVELESFLITHEVEPKKIKVKKPVKKIEKKLKRRKAS